MDPTNPQERQSFIQQFASRLRFPQLFTIVLVLFVVDLFVPDPIPFVDEILFGLLTVLLASLRKGKEPEPRVVKNVTPRNPG